MVFQARLKNGRTSSRISALTSRSIPENCCLTGQVFRLSFSAAKSPQPTRTAFPELNLQWLSGSFVSNTVAETQCRILTGNPICGFLTSNCALSNFQLSSGKFCLRKQYITDVFMCKYDCEIYLTYAQIVVNYST